MAVAARIFEETSTRPPTPPPGFLRLLSAVIERFGGDAFEPSELDASIEIGPKSAVFTLTVPVDRFDEASQFAASLCVEVEARFSERYALLVVPESTEE